MSRTPSPTPDHDPRAKNLALFFLRAGLGSAIFNQGLNDYLAIQAGTFPTGYPTALPYLQIILGLALMLGVFTIPSTISAGIYVMFSPFIQTAINIGGGAGGGSALTRGGWTTFPYFDPGMASHLLLTAAVLWLSPPGVSPWSFDSLIFKRNDRPALIPTEPEPSPPPPPPEPQSALPPGERTAKFLASRRDVES